MGVRITDSTHVYLYCSTTGRAFGPEFTSGFEAEDFLEWLRGVDKRDPRLIPEAELDAHLTGWRELQADSDIRIYGAGAA